MSFIFWCFNVVLRFDFVGLGVLYCVNFMLEVLLSVIFFEVLVVYVFYMHIAFC